MNVEITELLGEEIINQIQNLSSLEPGSEEHSTAVESVAKLYRLKNEDDKNEIDEAEKHNRRLMDAEQNIIEAELKRKQIEMEVENLKRELEIKEKQLRGQSWDRWINLGIAIFSTGAGIVAYDIWHRRSLRFEEVGSIISPQTRNLCSRMLPKLFRN